MFYSVLDTNVIVSALLKKDSIPAYILEQAFIGDVIPVFCDEIISEYDNVLHRKKFDFPAHAVKRIISGITNRGILVQINTKGFDVSLPDPKDFIFYAVARTLIYGQHSYLVTGNIKHFPSEPFILTPREFFSLINVA